MTAGVVWRATPVRMHGTRAIEERTAFATDAAPGLCVMPVERGDRFGGEDRGFSVTHVESGLAILTFFDRREHAEQALLFIAPLADWTRPAADVQYDEALRAKLVANLPEIRTRFKMIAFFGDGFDTRTGRVIRLGEAQ
jgi:hypothetical protein